MLGQPDSFSSAAPMAGASSGAISSTRPTEVSTRAASRPLKWSRTEAAAITTVAPPPTAWTTRSR